MAESDPKSELEIQSDADWKQKVKQEAAEQDARRQQETAGTTDTAAGDSSSTEDASSPSDAGPDIDAGQLPPADFTMLVTMFSTQAMVALGVIPSPDSGKAEQNLPLAKHFIDLLGVLQEKTRRNLTGHESDLLENSLHELRLAYVELSKSPASAPTDTSESTDTST